MGDTCDNVPGCFSKTKGDKSLSRGFGEKTARIFRDDPNLLIEKFQQYPEALKQYEVNKILVSFKNIPKEIREAVKERFTNE